MSRAEGAWWRRGTRVLGSWGLRAFEELGVPVELIGGNSMGALIGAQYANAMFLDEVLERTHRFAMGGERLPLPLISLLSGQRISRNLRRMFGERTIQQRWRPFFDAACNLTRVETTVFDSAPLWRAVLASNSSAGLLPPVVYQGDLLEEGAFSITSRSARCGRLGALPEQRRGNGLTHCLNGLVGTSVCQSK